MECTFRLLISLHLNRQLIYVGVYLFSLLPAQRAGGLPSISIYSAEDWSLQDHMVNRILVPISLFSRL